MTATRATRFLSFAAAGVLVLGAAACGGDDDDDDASTGSGDDSSDTSGGQTVEITSPGDGDDVEAGGFEVSFDSSEDLGPTDTGKHHVHLFYDGSDTEYDVVESDSFTVDSLDEGEHTLKAVLANADHSLTDASDEVTVTVGAGGGDGGGGSDDDDPYGY